MKKNNQHFHEDQAEPRLLTIFVTFEFFYKSHRGIMSSAKITYIFLHKIGGGGEEGREGGREGVIISRLNTFLSFHFQLKQLFSSFIHLTYWKKVHYLALHYYISVLMDIL